MTPTQKPGKSEQTVCTPREFLDAVERRFGGHKSPYPKDLALYAYMHGLTGSEVWDWRAQS